MFQRPFLEGDFGVKKVREMLATFDPAAILSKKSENDRVRSLRQLPKKFRTLFGFGYFSSKSCTTTTQKKKKRKY